MTLSLISGQAWTNRHYVTIYDAASGEGILLAHEKVAGSNPVFRSGQDGLNPSFLRLLEL